MNNLYGQTQILGKATATTQSIDNGLFNYVLPYNEHDFYAYSEISFTDISYCPLLKIKDEDVEKKCNENPLRTDITLQDPIGNNITLKNNYCYTRELCKNKSYADQVISMDQTHAANDGQYLDILTHTNTQTLNITNLSVGIIIMLVMAFSYV
mgnify:CR=1 FL=1